MESKYTIGNVTISHTTKLQLKQKLSPILFKSKIGPPSPKKIKLGNDSLNKWPKTDTSVNKPRLSIQDQRRNLPIFDKRNKLLELIERHKTLIILGETGSGKTTQIPQYIYSARLQVNGKIGISQPRRVAAISVALRVVQEFGQGVCNIRYTRKVGLINIFPAYLQMQIGEVVGYRVRFEDNTSKKTKIKFLTDGMLLREAMFDRLLMEYTVIILDEAHERTINTDVLFGVVKKAQKIREERNLVPLKVAYSFELFKNY